MTGVAAVRNDPLFPQDPVLSGAFKKKE